MHRIPLKNISKIINSGLTPLRSNERFWLNGNIPWVKTEQLGKKYIYESNEKITKYALENTSIKLNPVNTLSIAMYGEGKTRGSVSILKNETTTNQACCNIVIDKEKAEFEFVYYYLKTQYDNLRNLSSGVRKNLNSNDIKNFEVLLPSIQTQKQIAKVLSDLDAKIEVNNKINQELEAMAKTLYDYWFVQFDFPDANGKPYKSSGGNMVFNNELKREIPEGWKDGVLSDIANITMGQSPSGSSYNEEGEGTVFYQGSTDFGSRFPTVRKYTTEPSRMAEENDILLSVRAPVGTLNQAMESCCIGRGLAALREKEGSISFLWSQMEYFKQIFDRRNSSGTTFGSITKDDLFNLKLCIANNEILEKFKKIADPFHAKIVVNSKENQKLTELRDWLLPMLMNGQVTAASLRGTKQSHDVNSDDALGMVAEGKVKYGEV
ncbi:restriction endonuclease subunit S [Mariniflexile litorale]|uniref:Restriction endonuclease subunit S n=1 Tax=Mariniflexile litorale TaxID=3045158 RepID=A0AAU7EEH2_9FLAO|nr:restriction endonuclease subunit S [Mariniflexile sp. KMM 9835]MDQ8212324.1 restriction endonuclease subunit S [Mariniflexile sp. KMM 9835]